MRKLSLLFDVGVTLAVVVLLWSTVSKYEARKLNESIYFRDWLVLTGLPADAVIDSAIDHDWLSSVGGETRVAPREQMVVATSKDVVIPWIRVHVDTQEVPLILHNSSPTGRTTDIVGYAYTEFSADTATKKILLVRHDDDVRIWLNGKRVLTELGDRSAERPALRIPVVLRQGTNSLLVKVTQKTGGWGFSLQLDAPNAV